ncbi:hypothetical protein AB1Y20_011556 [Prymnesium parvum]|uniref:NACHT domain-containing protein n=1 Tax=Prymnesium parvum TaxID=97485 RepID=A0AB34IIW4_PRYPA
MRLRGGGCGASHPSAADGPPRVEIAVISPDAPTGIAYRSASLSKGVDSTNAEFRIDNSTDVLVGRLRKPEMLQNSMGLEFFESQGEIDGDGNDEEHKHSAASGKDRLPTKIGAALTFVSSSGEKISARIAPLVRYDKGTRLMVVLEDELADVTVLGAMGPANKHKLKLADGSVVKVDLNAFNHSTTEYFETAGAYEAARVAFCERVVASLGKVQDAITNNVLDIEEQTVYINTDTGKDAVNSGQAKLGVQRPDWQSVVDMPSLSKQMLKPSPQRAQGLHEAQPVLIRAGPGTGKTWSLQQLAWLLAKELRVKQEPVPQVPLLVRVQRIAEYADSSKREGFDNLLLAYIDKEHSEEDKKVILQAYHMRSLIVILDGIDEAAAIKGMIEDLVLDDLAPAGIRTAVSSRPEGVRLDRFTPTFVVMNLRALSVEQQQKAILHQLRQNVEFEHLSSLKRARAKASAPSEEACLTSFKENAMQSYLALYSLIEAVHGLSDEKEVHLVMNQAVAFFEEASSIPVLLSMLVLFFSGRKQTDKLPTQRLELYRAATAAALRRRLPDAGQAKMASVMLARVAVANHLMQKREFDSTHVARSLEGVEGGQAIWRKLLADPAGVPLVKTLELSADDSAVSTFQFTHLSFQEGYFVDAILQGEDLPTLWSRGALRVLDDRWFLNTFSIGGQEIGAAIQKHLPSSTESLCLSDHQCKALVALKWEPLRGKPALHTLRLPRCTVGVEGMAPLARMLRSTNELQSLKVLDFGVPTSVGLDVARLISEATAAREGLLLHGDLYAAHRDSIGGADAILIAATVRNFVGRGSPAGAKLADDLIATARLEGGHVTVGPHANLAAVLKAEGCNAASLTGCPPTDLKIAGFGVPELLECGLTTGDLVAVGFSAKELLKAGLSLSDLVAQGLEMEALAMGAPLEEVRAASGVVPSEDDMKAAFSLGPLSFLTSPGQLKSEGKVDGPNKSVTDKDCVKLAWMIARFAPSEVREISLPRNDISTAGVTALAQLLRLNTSVVGVNLHENNINDEAAVIFAKMLSFNTSLQVIRLSNNFFTDQGSLALVEGLMANSNIESLTLERELIPVKELKGAKVTGILDLSMRGYGRNSAVVVCKLLEASSPDVEKLILDRNPLAEGAWAIADMLKANNQLKELHLRMVGMGFAAAIAIADALKENSTLEKIVLIGNTIGVKGAKAVEEMLPFNNALRHIDLRENRLSPEAIKALRAAAARKPDLQLFA